MIIVTKNSTYRLTQDGTEAVLKKIKDSYPGGHPNVRVGDVFRGRHFARPVVGESFYLDEFGSSAVIKVEPERGDESLQFELARQPSISAAQFESLLKSRLGDRLARAYAVFCNYGSHLSWDVANVLLHAVDKKKVDEVLGILERHYTEHLQYQHPDIRGHVTDKLLGINVTEIMFVDICKKTLGLAS